METVIFIKHYYDKSYFEGVDYNKPTDDAKKYNFENIKV